MNEFTCTSCGAVHEYTIYLKSVLKDRPQHACPACGAVHVLSEGAPVLLTPGMQFTKWYGNDQEPVTDGFYQLQFLNGHVPENNWWWKNATGRFHFNEESPPAIALSSVNGWRALRNPNEPEYL